MSNRPNREQGHLRSWLLSEALWMAAAMPLVLAWAGCDSMGRGEMGGLPSCETGADCGAAEQCVDGRCAGDPNPLPGAADHGGPGSSHEGPPCPVERDCPAGCCQEGEVCEDGHCLPDCGGEARCDWLCCEAGQMCLADQCVAECDDPARLCGDADELCCGANEACLGSECVPFGRACDLTEECPLDELCEPTLSHCVPRASVEVCEYQPPVGEFAPVLACRWTPPAGDLETSSECEMTPVVANLTDDNGDGLTDTLDTPDIVFVSYDKRADGCCTARGVVRIVSGACNEDGTMTTIATLAEGSPWVGASTGIAVGNLHPDTLEEERPPEIVATSKGGGTVAWTRAAADGSQWVVYWHNEEYISPDHTPGAGAQPHLADLDGNGSPEVIIGNVVLSGQTGELIWDGSQTVGPGAGVGNNAFLGPNTTVADIDRDGTPEVIAGNTVYDGRTGAEEWTFEYSTENSWCQGRAACDGFNAVANFDADPEGEVVIVRQGEVFVLEHTGDLKHRVVIPWDDCVKDDHGTERRANESGPPTVADFDGDGRPEIGTASADFYVVIDFDCVGDPLPEGCESENVRWTVANQDCSSRVTGSSVFDFDGDGRAEVVYADELTFRIFDGRTGEILFEDDTHRSNTRMEMPIVVDVDNDGQAEVVVPEPNPDVALGGIEIWEDAAHNWVRTRRVWNQHGYHVTNITEDGQVPRQEEANWLRGRLNNFRQNVQPAGLFDAPDLLVATIEDDGCTASGQARIAVAVRNDGAMGVRPGIAVHVTAESEDGQELEVVVAHTTTRLLPGMSETVIVEWAPDGGWSFDTFTVTATVDQDEVGAGSYNECHEDNNRLQSDVLAACRLG